MADGVIVTGSALSDIPTQCTGPQPGTQCNAGDVTSPLGTCMDGLKTIRDGSPTVSGAWTYSGANAGAHPTLTVTGAAGQAGATISAGSGNAPGAVIAGDGNREGLSVQGGQTGPGIVVDGGTTSGNAIQATALGGNSTCIVATGHGNGYALDATGGATAAAAVRAAADSGSNGLGLAAFGDGSGAAVKATAGGSSNIAVSAVGGGVTIDTGTPGSAPPANTIYKDKIVAAMGELNTTGNGTTALVNGAFTNCSVAINADHTMLDVTFDTDMSGTAYAVDYGTGEYAGTGLAVPMTVIGSKTASGFSIRVKDGSGMAKNFATDTNTIWFDFKVTGAQ